MSTHSGTVSRAALRNSAKYDNYMNKEEQAEVEALGFAARKGKERMIDCTTFACDVMHTLPGEVLSSPPCQPSALQAPA